MVKYIPGLTNSMPNYSSRSPVEDAEEDSDEVSLVTSQSTQTDFEFNNEYSPIVAPVHTSSTQLHNATSHDSTNTPRITRDTLPLSSSTVLPDSLVGENRTIPFSTEQLIAAQRTDTYANNIIHNITKHNKYFMQDNILMRRSNPPVPYVPQGELRNTILKICHDTATNGAHFGRDKTIHKIKKRYFWPSMYKDINTYIKSCILCAQYNPRRNKTPGTLRPIPPPDGV